MNSNECQIPYSAFITAQYSAVLSVCNNMFTFKMLLTYSSAEVIMIAPSGETF